MSRKIQQLQKFSNFTEWISWWVEQLSYLWLRPIWPEKASISFKLVGTLDLGVLWFDSYGAPPPLWLVRVCSWVQGESNGGGNWKKSLQEWQIHCLAPLGADVGVLAKLGLKTHQSWVEIEEEGPVRSSQMVDGCNLVENLTENCRNGCGTGWVGMEESGQGWSGAPSLSHFPFFLFFLIGHSPSPFFLFVLTSPSFLSFIFHLHRPSLISFNLSHTPDFPILAPKIWSLLENN